MPKNLKSPYHDMHEIKVNVLKMQLVFTCNIIFGSCFTYTYPSRQKSPNVDKQ